MICVWHIPGYLANPSLNSEIWYSSRNAAPASRSAWLAARSPCLLAILPVYDD
jgi:hypothetical protein